MRARPLNRARPPDWGKMRRWFSQAIRWKILLPRRYRVAAWIIGFFLGAVVGTALDVANPSAAERWAPLHSRAQLNSGGGGTTDTPPNGRSPIRRARLQSRLTRSPKNATSNGILGDIGSSGDWDSDLARRHGLSTHRHNYVGMGTGRTGLPWHGAETDRVDHPGRQ